MMSKIAIRLGAIENNGPNTLVSYLRNAGSTASQIDIAVAFVTATGLESVFHLLKKTSTRGRVRLLTGLYQGFTEPKALRVLLREQQQSDGKFIVQISTDKHFHWKTYFLQGKTSARIVIGSSNLTDDGLRQTGEYNAVLSLPSSSKEFRELHGVFERHWRSRSKKLTEDVLSKYERWRDSVEIANRFCKVPVESILATERKKPKAEVERQPSFWRTYLNGSLSAETEAMLSETTDWDRRGYEYFSTWRESFGIGDRIVLFDRGRKIVNVVEVKETTRTPSQTPDGRYFAAFRQVRGTPLRKLVATRWKSMKVAGLIRRNDDAYTTRRLSAAKFDAFMSNLKQAAR